MADRLKKINELLVVEVGRILEAEVEFDEGVLVTVIGANVSPTLEHANIRISVFPKEHEKTALQKIENKIYQIQQILNKKLSLRKVPKLRFVIDETEERAGRIIKILGDIEEK